MKSTKSTAFLLILLALPASGATVSLLPVADGSILDRGILGFSVADTTTYVRTISSGRDTRGVFEFDLSSIPAGSTITSVELILTTWNSVSNTDPTADISFTSFAGDGAITEADFDAPGTVQANESYVLPVNANTELTIPMSDLTLFQNLADTGGVVAIRTDTVNFVTFNVHSSEGSVPSSQMPNLRITYIPEPSTSLSMLASLGLLARRSRRRSR